MWLRVPEAITDLAWEGELVPDEEPPEVTRGDETAGGGGASHELPVVSIGRPEVWNLLELYPRGKLPLPVRAKLDEAKFYLVRLSCSFRPMHDRGSIDWARFTVSLQPDPAGRDAIAFDLYPLLVSQEVKRNLKVSIAPSLKFQEVEAKVGGIDFGFEYPEIQPTISASGAGESEPAWDFAAATGAQIQGSKWMHLLLRANADMMSCEARLQLTADVVGAGFRIPVFSRPTRTSADPLVVRLFG